MNVLVNQIDSEIEACVGKIRNFGLCHTLQSDNESFPATVETNAKVKIDNKSLYITYHRLLNATVDQAEDNSFGRKMRSRMKQNVRFLIFVRSDMDDTAIDDFINAIPSTLTVDGYSLVSVAKDSVNRNRAAIWSEEFSKAYVDRYQLVFRIYAVEYSLNYIKCNPC